MKRKSRFRMTIVLLWLLGLLVCPQQTLGKSLTVKSGDSTEKAVQTKSQKKGIQKTPSPLKKQPLKKKPSLKKEGAAPSTKTAPEKPKTLAPQKKESPLKLGALFLEDGTVRVTITATGKGKITAADYAAFKLVVETDEHKQQGRWSLLKVDPRRRLGSKQGKVTFDTRMGLEKRGTVQATLSRGLWKTSLSETLSPQRAVGTLNKRLSKPPSSASTMSEMEKGTTQVRKQAMGTTQAGETAKNASAIRTIRKSHQAKPDEGKPIVPMVSYDGTERALSRSHLSVNERLEEVQEEDDDIYRSMGITISSPRRGRNYETTDAINVRYIGSPEMADGEPVTFRLFRGGLIVDTQTRTLPHYSLERTLMDGTSAIVPVDDSFEWEIPAGAPLSDRYWVHAIQEATGAVGFGHYFEVSSRFSLSGERTTQREVIIPIEILEPVADDEVIWGHTRPIVWTMPEEDESVVCGNRVTIYAIRENTDTEIELAQVNTSPGRNTWDWPVSPDHVEIGRYQIAIESSEGCRMNGAAFEIKSCDYAMDSVCILDGSILCRSMETGIDARDDRGISGTFRVKLLWNRMEMPEALATETEWGNRLTVRSKLTNQIINTPREGINFDYSTARNFGDGPGGTRIRYVFVEVPFEFPRDDIAHMMNDSRNIPLEFSFEPTGTSVDTDGSNNELEADLKVLFADIVDFEILFYIDDFSAPRDSHTPRSATSYQYYFSQRIQVRNAARTVVGGVPDDILNVPVDWHIEYRTAHDSEWHSSSSGRFLYPVVGGDWGGSRPLVEGSFTTPIDAPERTYRLRMVVDPDREYIDADRSTNEFSNTLNLPD